MARKAMVDHAFLCEANCSLILFDEAHHAVRGHPFVQIVASLGPSADVRIVGLTASFLHGKLCDPQRKRALLELNLRSRLWVPKEEEMQGYSLDQHFERVPYEESDIDAAWAVERTEQILAAALEGAPDEARSALEGNAKKAGDVLVLLGQLGWSYFVAQALCPMARAKMEAKARNIDNTKTKEQLQEAMQHLSDLQQRLLSACSGGASAAEEGVEGECDEEANAPAPRYSGKVEALLSLLKYLSEEADDSEQPLRCMIFCERVATTYPLSYLINDFLGKQVSLPVSGVSAMTESVRNANLEAFNVGRVGMLVATSSLEEGIDIQKCNVVIRFDIFHNVKSHVQGAGTRS
ncbi:unnamed protein product [Prorocentrum cordatum]|uniref:Helicase C-terminal domain-containing protein n=1 Tax=Prorocentrum cordatum TaxID=2364126 RepID=A0ABN9XSV8_9DINO|nr:unnamed protein product [Polarella glacialis]